VLQEIECDSERLFPFYWTCSPLNKRDAGRDGLRDTSQLSRLAAPAVSRSGRLRSPFSSPESVQPSGLSELNIPLFLFGANNATAHN
jgi:hypothetical protein